MTESLHNPSYSSGPLSQTLEKSPEGQMTNLNEASLGQLYEQSHQTNVHLRESREKKDSFKKRQSVVSKKGNPSSAKMKELASSVPLPMRYNLPQPRMADFEGPRDPVFTSHEPVPFLTPDGQTELKKPTDHAENKRAYRYTHCIADSLFKHKQFYRQSDSKPYGPRMSFEDSDIRIHFDPSGKIVTNEKGWRMSRANVAVREGSFYYEVKIIKGLSRDYSMVHSTLDQAPKPHIRMGWARREAPLDAPVGFDGYSYGITDIRFETMHRSRPGKFFDAAGIDSKNRGHSKAKNQPTREVRVDADDIDHVREGDVVGLEINLPSMSLQQKIASGEYNPAVDMDAGFNDPVPGFQDVIRDRIPVPYKGNLYFEQLEYQATKPMEQYGERGPFNKIKTNPNHAESPLRTLPHSSIKVYKNGKLAGTAFENLLSFLPRASQPAPGTGARIGFDDGMLGYFPAIAAFSGGIAEMNFGPEFWYAPWQVHQDEHDTPRNTLEATKAISNIRPLSERYKEQIVEDILFDLVDEVSFFMEDRGTMNSAQPTSSVDTNSVANLHEG